MALRRAFSAVELLVVLALIFILIALLIPSSQAAREMARRVKCMSNLHQVSVAWLQYAADHEGVLLCPDSQQRQAGAPADQDSSRTIPDLYPYAPGIAVFHCPDDWREGMVNYSLRSYSINDYLGGTWPQTGYQHAKTLREVGNAPRTFLFIEEAPPPQQNGATGGFIVDPYPALLWINFPAPAHGGGTCLSFVDGHCEYWQWDDQSTLTLLQTSIQQQRQFISVTQDHSIDLVRLQAVEGFGNVPPP